MPSKTHGRVTPVVTTILATAMLLATPHSLWAHGTERGLVMLLPTSYYALGAMLAVAFSFILLLSSRISIWLERIATQAIVLLTYRPKDWITPSLISFSFFAFCILVGLHGSPDPLSNLLPLTIWTGWWIGFTLLQVLTGDLWRLLNPWRGPLELLSRATKQRVGKTGLISLPEYFGYWPAVFLFGCFAWFELASVSPEDPIGLSHVAGTYWLVIFVCSILFGIETTLQRIEPFSILFRLVGAFSPFVWKKDDTINAIGLQLPGSTLLRAPALPFSGTFLVLVTLGSATFDGLSETFSWMGFWNLNPLEYSGRSSTLFINTIGLILTPIVLGLGFFTALLLGNSLAKGKGRPTPSGRIVFSLVPIAIAFHGAHYLTLLLMNGQYLVKAWSDPFSLGWNIFGTAHHHVTASMIQNIDTVWIIWCVQVAIITIGHVVGIVLAHLIAMQTFKTHSAAAKSQVFLATLMVLYTVFGLWLLSTPTIG